MTLSLVNTYGPAGMSSANPLPVYLNINANTKLLVLAIIVEGITARTGGAPTLELVEMQPSGEGFVAQAAGECGVEVWYYVDPPTGISQDLLIPNTGSATISILYHEYQYTESGVSLVDAGSGTGTTANPSLTTASIPANCLVIGALASGYRNVPTAGTNYAIGNSDYDAGAFVFAMEYDLDAGAAGTKTVDFTQSADDWGFIYVVFQETSGNAMPVFLSDRRRRT